MYTSLESIEKEYLKKVQDALQDGQTLSAELLLALSVALYRELKVKGISDSDDADNDMLLYQYGTFDWGDEFGRHFSLDITRQFCDPEQDEPYQLRFTLIYEPEHFKGIQAYDCWSDSYSDINHFAASIETTEGFQAAAKHAPITYELCLEQC